MNCKELCTKIRHCEYADICVHNRTSCPNCADAIACRKQSWQWVVFGDGTIIKSTGAFNLLGYTDDELIGQNIFNKLIIIESGGTHPIKLRHKNGTTIHCTTAKERHYGPGGNLIRVAGTTQIDRKSLF